MVPVVLLKSAEPSLIFSAPTLRRPASVSSYSSV